MINACKATPLDAICHCVYHHFSLLCLHELYIPVVAVVVVVVVVVDDDDEVCSDLFIYLYYFVTIFSKARAKFIFIRLITRLRNINETQQGLNSH